MTNQHRNLDEVSFQLAPMIDITFLLLIFFMVTTKITKDSKKMEIALPTASSAKTPEELSGREMINLDKHGTIFIGNTPSSMKELKAYLRQRLIDYPPLRIYVRADSQTPAREIKKIMNAAAEAGAIEVIFGSYRSN